jgi:hypothetical protein
MSADLSVVNCSPNDAAGPDRCLHARAAQKWPTMRPTIFPGSVLVFALLIASAFAPLLLAVAVLLPQLMYPVGLRLAVMSRQPACLLDPYVRLAQEAYGNVGYLQGLWRHRGFVTERAASVSARHSQEKTVAGAAI